MSAKATLFVLVEDAEEVLIGDADVSVYADGEGKRTKVHYDQRLRRHVLSGLRPGPYEIQVKGPEGTLKEHRTLSLKAGENHVVVMVAERGLLRFNAGGMNFYFRLMAGVMLLSVKRAKTQRQVTDILDSAQLQYRVLPDRNGRIVADDLLLLVRIGEGTDAKRNQSTLRSLLRSAFPEHGLRARLSLPSEKRGEIAFGITDEIVVRFESWVTKAQRKEIAARYGLSILRTIAYLGSGFLLQLDGPLDYRILDIIEALHGSREVTYAEPNLLLRLENCQHTPNDYLYPEVPHLGLIRCDDAWASLGNQPGGNVGGSPTVTIGVLEPDGIDPTHPDLTGPLSDSTEKMAANFDFNNMTNQDPANVVSHHGTQSAGSASAKMDNNVGIPGVAPNCRLICARSGGATIVDIGDMLIWMAGFPTGSTDPDFPAPVPKGADILSNSWLPVWTPDQAVVRDVFDFLTTYGRGGRGCLICFAAGNWGHVSVDGLYPLLNDAKSLVVGASINVNPTNPCSSMHVDPNGQNTNLPAAVDTRAYYSVYGMSLDLVAPSSTSLVVDFINSVHVDPILDTVRTDMGNWPGSAVNQTTIAAAVAAGATDVTVADSTGFQAGEYALFGSPGSSPNETRAITAVTPGQISVSALENAYPAGTTVATGANDYARNPYVGYGGTSHACPTVAGAAALLLSAKADLTWIELRRLLVDNAVKIDLGQTASAGQWFDRDGDGTIEFSQWYGYGRLEVAASVDATIALTQRADVVLRDNLSDIGTVPSSGWHAHSPDLWVRRTNDSIPTLPYDSTPPHESPRYGQDNYVYVRVKNFGNATAPVLYVRTLITHFPGIEFRYPEDWQPTPRPGELPVDPLVPGSYLIGEQQITDLGPGASTIVKMTWARELIPPETVTVSGDVVRWHPCLLGEVSPHDGPPPVDNAYPVKGNNNIAHRNLSIAYAAGWSAPWFLSAVIAGTRSKKGVDALLIDRSKVSPECNVLVRAVDPKLMSLWTDALQGGDGLKWIKIQYAGAKSKGKGEVEERNLFLDHVKLCKAESLDLKSECILAAWGDEATKTTETVGSVERRGHLVLSIAHSAPLVSIPLRIPGGKFSMLLIGMEHREEDKTPCGTLLVSQIRGDGVISPGYEIQ